MTKRLFIFAGYDANGVIDDALLHYVRALSRHGDIVLCMDSDCKKSELDKIKPFVLHAIAVRHGEYDFGSYKRAYTWARDKKILTNYDDIYLVNDSVFGPLFDIKQTLKNMESTKTDATGLVVAHHKTHAYMESWFVRLGKKVFLSQWFDTFIMSVQHEEHKYIITVKYEHGLTNLIQSNGCTWAGVYNVRGRHTYNNPKRLFQHGCPFIKRACFTRHNGAAGAQIRYIMNHIATNIRNAIMTTSNRVYGEKYMCWLMTGNPIRICIRNIKYALKKLKSGEI